MPPDRYQRQLASSLNARASPYARPNNNQSKPEYDYIFDFGKHKTKPKPYHEVRTDKGYIRWLIEKRIYDRIPGLRKALEADGLIKREGEDRPVSSLYSASAPARIEDERKFKQDADVKQEVLTQPAAVHIQSKPSSSATNIPKHSPTDFVIWIKPHKGKKVSEVPLYFLHWIMDKTELTEKDPLLKEAILARGVTPIDKNARIKSGWSTLTLAKQPSKFYDPWTHKSIWITDRDARTYFPSSGNLLTHLPKYALKDKNTRRHLYHVWALARDHASRAVADACLRSFLEKNEDQEEFAMGAMGLGCCFTCGPDGGGY